MLGTKIALDIVTILYAIYGYCNVFLPWYTNRKNHTTAAPTPVYCALFITIMVVLRLLSETSTLVPTLINHLLNP